MNNIYSKLLFLILFAGIVALAVPAQASLSAPLVSQLPGWEKLSPAQQDEVNQLLSRLRNSRAQELFLLRYREGVARGASVERLLPLLHQEARWLENALLSLEQAGLSVEPGKKGMDFLSLFRDLAASGLSEDGLGKMVKTVRDRGLDSEALYRAGRFLVVLKGRFEIRGDPVGMALLVECLQPDLYPQALEKVPSILSRWRDYGSSTEEVASGIMKDLKKGRSLREIQSELEENTIRRR